MPEYKWHTKNSGFTLIEMLVVLLIMGILVGLVSTIVQPDDSALLRVEADRLVQLMNIAETESRFSGKPVAWTADRTSYRFWQFSEDKGWCEINDNNLLRARTLPAGMAITDLRIENKLSSLPMRVEFTPYDSTLIFSVAMSLGNAHFTVANSLVGDVQVLPETGGADDKTVRH
jgi:general secretion pathway protein H